MAARMLLLHLITGLDMGGAEMMLYRLLKHMDRDRFENQVISMIPPGMVAARIEALGIPVTTLGMKSGHPWLKALYEMTCRLRKVKPAILETWMYHADLLGGMAGALTGVPVVWGIHNTSLDPALVKSGTIRVVHTNARLSRFLPRRIIICSEQARRQHVSLGYAAQKFITIPNGFELDVFKPDASARQAVRMEAGIPLDALVIGMVARFDPLKDHRTFASAAGIFFKQHPQVQFLLCGRGVSWENEKLSAWINETGFKSNFHLLGYRDDIPRVMNALDIHTLSSAPGVPQCNR